MEELKRMGYFTKVVETKSFTEAARQLGKTKSVVSRQVALLEDMVGARLLNRTTRNLSLTDAGDIYYQHCRKIMHQAALAFDEVRGHQDQPSGTLRLSCPVYFGTVHAVPLVHEFMGHYPNIKIDLLLDDQIMSLVDENIDIAIRSGPVKDGNLVTKNLFSVPTWLVASPEYIEHVGGVPTSPADLKSERLITFLLAPSPFEWTFSRATEQQAVPLSSNVRVNNVAAARALAMVGSGIAALPSYAIYDDVMEGRLVRLLTDYHLREIDFQAVYPQSQALPPKTRLFLEFLMQKFQGVPWGAKG